MAKRTAASDAALKKLRAFGLIVGMLLGAATPAMAQMSDDGRDWATASAATGGGMALLGVVLSIATAEAEPEPRTGTLLGYLAAATISAPFASIAALQAPAGDVAFGLQTVGWFTTVIGAVFGVVMLASWLAYDEPEPVITLVACLLSAAGNLAFGMDGLERALP